MAFELRWSRTALEDIEGIARYLAIEAPFYANAVVTRIITVAENTVEFSLAGRSVPEWGNPEYRERFVYNYRIIYRVLHNSVIISAVMHGKRSIDSLEDRIE